MKKARTFSVNIGYMMRMFMCKFIVCLMRQGEWRVDIMGAVG